MQRASLIFCTAVVFLCGASSFRAQSTRKAPATTRNHSRSLLPQAKTAPKITAIRAQLFYDATGTFSEDLLSQKDLSLWNTVIGEGGAGGASTSTFVTVEISGRNLTVGATKVEITVTGNKNRVVQKKLIGVDIYDERVKFFAPLWLHDTGCEQLKISARLIGPGAPRNIVTRTIPFACGE